MAEPLYRMFAIHIEEINPRTSQSEPSVFVGLGRTRTESHEEEVTVFRKKNLYYGSRFVRAMPELVPAHGFKTRRHGIPEANALRQDLAHRGFSVNPSDGSTYRLYVVNLDSNGLRPESPRCVYVGQTSIEVTRRVQQHRRGYKAAKVASAFREINWTLTPSTTEFHSQWDAVAAETALGRKLQTSGYQVWGPQLLGPT